jgi:prevent-host-death family protein
MSRVITQRQLRNESGEIMRALDRGEVFIITRNGVPVGELRPVRRRIVSRDVLLALRVGVPRSGRYEQFRRELDDVVDQTIEPRVR